uniref:Glycoside hydrolase family 38 central domain-containing protein n=1 Tax=Tetradesmus obliquus TaxID=3088 RepID=A0A383VWB2_TETOB|eukprot:jgi/Sobl393_1/11771/SZX69054.1
MGPARPAPAPDIWGLLQYKCCRCTGGVEAILDSVVSSLVDNPDRTLMYADLAFFVKWWQELHEDSKAEVRQLVQQGRFEFTGGGIVQHDEADSHYSGMVDQMSLGMRFLQQEFGHTPRIAWQLNGFGHSRTEPLLKSMGGFDALFFGRADEADMRLRKANRSMELAWRGSESYGSETDMFTSQYPTGTYGPPGSNWFFEHHSGHGVADSINDDPETGGYNVQEMVDTFVQKALEWHNFVGAGTDYWTGYFTSRPNLKAQVRRGWALLRAIHQVEVLAQLQPGSRQLATSKGLQYQGQQEASETVKLGQKLAPDKDPAALEFALATSLHHDGITGTQVLQVTQDYEQWIHVGMVKAAPKLLLGLQQLVFPGQGSYSTAAASTSQSHTGGIFRRRLRQQGQLD